MAHHPLLLGAPTRPDLARPWEPPRSLAPAVEGRAGAARHEPRPPPGSGVTRLTPEADCRGYACAKTASPSVRRAVEADADDVSANGAAFRMRAEFAGDKVVELPDDCDLVRVHDVARP